MSDYSKLLKNKLSIITGCNRGIGKAILEIFAEQGSNIIACVRKKNPIFTEFINKISHKYNIEITPLYFDLTNLEEMKTELHIIVKKKMDIDILINNAGAINTSLFQMTTKDNINQMFDVNYFGTFFLTQFISKIMIRKKMGNIINISSSAAIEFNVGRSAYASSKAALIASSNVMSKELSNFNIRVNTIAPGLTDTDLMRESTTSETIEKTKQRISLKRLGMPVEIARVALFLASDMSSYITGQVIKVDGGLHEE